MTDEPHSTYVPLSTIYGKRARPSQKSSPFYSQVREANRRAQRRGLSDKLTVTEWEALVKHYAGRCLQCGRRESITIDHVVPLCKGGSNTIDNVQPMCKWCNSAKGRRTIDLRKNPPGLALGGGLDDDLYYKGTCK